MPSLTETFTNIANAIRAKTGGSATYTPAQMPTAISNIQTGYDTSDATATASNILATKTAYISTGKVTGSMINRGAVSPSQLEPNGSYTIPAGYHNGSGVVRARALHNEDRVISSSRNVRTITPSAGYDGIGALVINGFSPNYTVLWKNDSPSTALTSGSFTLSDDISNYDYLEIDCHVGTNSQSQAVVYVAANTFKSDFNRSSSAEGEYLVVNYTNSNYRFDRMFYYISERSIGYTTCHRHSASASSAQSAYIIPVYIFGWVWQ